MADKLRVCAERQLKSSDKPEEDSLSPEEMRRTLHELRVHQIELEMQNEELRRAQEELEGLRAKYFDLYDLAPIGYVTLNENGLLLETNITFASMLGVQRGAIVNRYLNRAIHKADQDVFYHHFKLLVSTRQPQECELRLKKADGTLFWVKMVTAPAEDLGKTTVYRSVMSDISNRKRAEELQAKVEGVIQHDLRSPACNAVNVATLLLEGNGLSDEQRQLLGLLNNAGRQMLYNLDRSLDLHKIETGQYSATAETFNCLPVILEIVQNLRNAPKHKKASIHVLMDGVTPDSSTIFPCSGQRELLRTALLNLIKNALEASPKGETVVISIFSGKDCRIEIRNRGAVPASIRERFFDKYSTAGKTHGTGIGTYSAKMMVEAQGGTLEMYTSDADDETVLTVHLPECPPSEGFHPGLDRDDI